MNMLIYKTSPHKYVGALLKKGGRHWSDCLSSYLPEGRSEVA